MSDNKNILSTALAVAALIVCAGILIVAIGLAGARNVGQCTDPLQSPGSWCKVGPAWLSRVDFAARTGACVLVPGDNVCCTIQDRTCCLIEVRSRPEMNCE